jgi:hypothetical protein
MDLSRALSEEVLRRGNRGIEVKVASHGEPTAYQHRRLIGVDAVLRAAGVYDGKPLDQTILAMLDLQTVVMSLSAAQDVTETLAEGVAVLGYLGRALAAEKDATVMAEITRAINDAPTPSYDSIGQLARRLRPAQPGPSSAA